MPTPYLYGQWAMNQLPQAHIKFNIFSIYPFLSVLWCIDATPTLITLKLLPSELILTLHALQFCPTIFRLYFLAMADYRHNTVLQIPFDTPWVIVPSQLTDAESRSVCKPRLLPRTALNSHKL